MTTMMPSRPTNARPENMPARPMSMPQQPVRAGTSIDPIRVIRRHMFGLIVSVVIGAVLGTGAFVLLDEFMPSYSGRAIFEIRPALQDATQVGASQLESDSTISRIAQTEGVIIMSRRVLTEAANRFELRDTDWYKSYSEGNTFDVESAVDDLEEDVSVGLIRGSNLFRIAWSAPNKNDVPAVINAIARVYNDVRSKLEQDELDTNITQFENSVTERTQQIESLDTEIAGFITRRGITSLDDARYSQAGIAVRNLTDQLSEIDQMLSVAMTTERQTAAKLQGTLEPTPEDYYEAEADVAVATLIQQVVGLKVQLRLAYDKFGSGHDQVTELEQRLSATELERDAKIEQVIRRNLEAKLKTVQDQIEQYDGVVEEAERELADRRKELAELSAAQASYEALENRRQFLESSRAADMELVSQAQLLKLRSDADRVRLRELAETPREKAFPKMEVIIPLGAILTLGLTLGVIFLREITDQRVKSASDLEVIPHAEVLGVIPDIGEDPTSSRQAELVVRHHPASVLAESFRQVSAPVMQAIETSGHQSVLITSGLPGSGVTTVLSNLAVTLAAAGKSVCLIDANFRRPKLAGLFGTESDHVGMGDVLAGEVSVEGVVQETEAGVSLISAGTPQNRIFERLGVRRLDEMLAELRERFDVVLIDVAPAVVAGDAMLLANKVDATVLVARANQEQRGLVARLIRQLVSSRSTFIGVVLNRPLGTAGGYLKKNYAAMAKYTAGSGKGKAKVKRK